MKVMADQLIRGWQNNKDTSLKKLVYSHLCELVQSVTEVNGHCLLITSQASSTINAAVVSRIGTGKKLRLKSSRELIARKQRATTKCKFCRLEGHVEANCPAKITLGRSVESLTFSTYILCDSPYRLLKEDDSITIHIPSGTRYICCIGTICKANRENDRTHFEWRNIAISLKCINDCGCVIESGIYPFHSL